MPSSTATTPTAFDAPCRPSTTHRHVHQLLRRDRHGESAVHLLVLGCHALTCTTAPWPTPPSDSWRNAAAASFPVSPGWRDEPIRAKVPAGSCHRFTRQSTASQSRRLMAQPLVPLAPVWPGSLPGVSAGGQQPTKPSPPGWQSGIHGQGRWSDMPARRLYCSIFVPSRQGRRATCRRSAVTSRSPSSPGLRCLRTTTLIGVYFKEATPQWSQGYVTSSFLVLPGSSISLLHLPGTC